MFQYRIYPTKKQLHKLNETLDECRWLYNHLLEKRKDAYEQEGKSLTCYGQQSTYPLLKQERPSLERVHSQVLQNVAVRIDLAFKAFFRRVKTGTLPGCMSPGQDPLSGGEGMQGKKPGFPRFRGKDRYDSFTFPQSGFSLVSVPQTASHDARVTLSKIGSVKMVSHRPLRGKIKTCTVHKSRTGKWYVCFSVECEPLRLPANQAHVGIDVGLKTFASLSTGEEIENPRFFRKEEKALAKVQRTHATLAKGTPQRHTHRKVIARVHERIAFRRENFTHQHSRWIVDRFGVIAVEDLHVKRMTHNHCLAKSIADASWSAFFAQLSRKAEEAGRVFVKVNPAYTSQECSRDPVWETGNHHRQKMPLSERIYHCPCCLLSIDRDLNASVNIKALGLQSVGLPLEAPVIHAGE